jgi:protocatechuate 3,4-dioxygenase beta subunit
MDSSAKLSRREALIGAGATGLAVMVGVKVNRGTGQAFISVGGDEAFAAGACTMQTPQKEIGPFFVDENLNRSDIRASSDGSNVQTGVPLALTIDIFDDDDSCNPIVGAKVNVWQANAIGVYSDEASESTTGQTWLRGYQLTGSDGKVSFTTIWPGWYSGRTCHIHFMVALPAVGSLPAATFICQLFFPEAETELVAATAPYTSNPNARTLNTADRVYSSDGASVSVTLSGDVSGYVASFSAGASRTAADTSGSGGGGGGGGGGGPLRR